MVWIPGQSGNPNGRPRKYPQPPPGIDPRYYHRQAAKVQEELKDASAELNRIAEDLELEDPVLFQHRKMMDESLPIGLRLAVATAIAPYMHPKLGVVTPPRFIETPIEVPDFKSIEEAETFLASLTTRFAQSEIGAQSALDLSTLARNWISAKHAAAELELKRLNADAANGDQIIRIEGGLPALPGSDIIMPELARDLAPGPLTPTKDSLSPLEPAAPVVAITVLQRVEAALLGWSESGRKGDVEIDGPTWDAMASIPRDALQALFDRYGVACPDTGEATGEADGLACSEGEATGEP
jgi:hypothetical protein